MTQLLGRDEFRAELETPSKAARPRTPRSARRGRRASCRSTTSPAGRRTTTTMSSIRRLPGEHLHEHARRVHQRQGLHAAEHVRRGTRRHPAHRPADQFGEACGTTRERIEDPSNMNRSREVCRAWCYAVSAREHFVVATAALVVGLESQVPSIYKKQIVPLREVYKFTEDEIEFFDLLSPPTSYTASAGTRSCSTTPTPRSCNSGACSMCGGALNALLLHQGSLRLLRRS